MTDLFDFSRPPTEKERLVLEARVSWLDNAARIALISRAFKSLPGNLPAGGIAIRVGFSYKQENIGTDASDRRALKRELRPPATRLMTPRGEALRFALTLLAVAQATRKAGAKAQLGDLGIGLAGSSGEVGWADMIVGDAVDSRNGGTFMTARNKRSRSVRSALLALEAAGLVFIPGAVGQRGRFEDFVLLNELGIESVGEREEYSVPKSNERTFVMPAGLVANGWLHVLEDSEIALLLMVACGRGGWSEGGLVAMPAEVRLLSYGIHRDAYSTARKTLEACGLLEVEEIRRHDDGRAEDGDLRVHRLGLIRGGFDAPAAERMLEALKYQIQR